MELGTIWIYETIMVSTVSYRLSQHGGVAHAYVLWEPILWPISVYCVPLPGLHNILL